MITVETIESANRFESLKDEWNQCLRGSGSDCLFLTWEWLYTWWTHLAEQRRLFIVTVRRDGELAAVAPLSFQPSQPARLIPFRSLQFLGSGSVGSDYLDVIVRRGSEHQVMPALTRRLADAGVMIELAQGCAGNAASRLCGDLRNLGWGTFEVQTHVCPYISLAGHSWASYLAALGGAHRYNFKRRLNNLSNRFAWSFEQARSEEERREALATLLRLHALRWEPRGGTDAFYSPALRQFHDAFSRLALDRGWLRLFTLRIGERNAAAVYALRYGRSFLFYQSGMHPEFGRLSAGLIAMGLSIKAAIEEGAEEYDLLHGEEPYKFHWARQKRELVRLELYPPGMRGTLYQGILTARRASKRIAQTLFQPAPEGSQAGAATVLSK